MNKYKIDNNIFNNILIFLDRVTIKGFKEIEAVQKIINDLRKESQEISELMFLENDIIKNILILLNRVEIHGLKEVDEMTKIINILNNPMVIES